jgi:hypothetical protein
MKREYEFNFQHQKEIFIFFIVPRLILAPPSLMSTRYRGSFLVREADNSPLSSAEVQNALNYDSTPLYGFVVWCLIKHCTLPLRVYNCIGILLVFIVDDSYEGGAESEAVNGNLVPQHERAVDLQSCGKINVINLTTMSFILNHHPHTYRPNR